MSVRSTISQIECHASRWSSWILGVTSEGAQKHISVCSRRWMPLAPVKPMVNAPHARPDSRARRTFGDWPLVLIPTTTSEGFASARTWREKISAYSQSFATQVNIEVSVVSAIAGHGSLLCAKRPTSSAATCCASAALPPFPKSKILFPVLIALTNACVICTRVGTDS